MNRYDVAGEPAGLTWNGRVWRFGGLGEQMLRCSGAQRVKVKRQASSVKREARHVAGEVAGEVAGLTCNVFRELSNCLKTPHIFSTN